MLFHDVVWPPIAYLFKYLARCKVGLAEPLSVHSLRHLPELPSGQVWHQPGSLVLFSRYFQLFPDVVWPQIAYWFNNVSKWFNMFQDVLNISRCFQMFHNVLLSQKSRRNQKASKSPKAQKSPMFLKSSKSPNIAKYSPFVSWCFKMYGLQ